MCLRVVERYAVCGCIYFTHGVDRCGAYGQHQVQDRVVLVGHTCPLHAASYNLHTSPSSHPSPSHCPSMGVLPDSYGSGPKYYDDYYGSPR
ncbi:hypothetical protein BZA05DRAFT_329765 [Tricharina praecox]|uniref:uncharacterized protein n=1 Tax=Tricharina praecox TaxID=43433 RepID=UPI002220098F|nr:uncharacterized protein BZA05DRAFT_329765 [Tricharina praecox]KAI5859044.1 hypothetical protein BZA05DRAFT_329765 [Tricharina praecox]